MIPISYRLCAALLAVPLLAGLGPVPAAVAQAQAPAEQLAAASALFDAGKYAEAAKELDAFLAANPKHPRAGAAALALGRCRTELKQYAKAVPAYEKAIAAKDPAVTTVAQLGLAEAALQTGQWAKAESALRAATQAGVTPQQAPIAYDWLGQASYQIGRYAAAEEAYRQVIEKYPDSDQASDAYFGAGLAALKQGKTADARTRLSAAVDHDPKSANAPQALQLLGQMDLDARQYEQARDEFSKALAASSLDAETRQAAEDGLVNALLKLGDYNGAATRLQTILAKQPPADPQRFGTEMALGRCLYLQKEYTAAEKAYKEAARAPDPKTAAQGFYWSANAALALNHPAEAAAQFAVVATRFPTSDLAAKAQLKAGDALAAAKQNQAAARAYRLVLDHYPKAPEAAEARRALGDLLGAATDPAQLSAALANAPAAERAAGTLRLARLYLDGKKYGEAARTLTGLLETTPAPAAAEAHYLLGLADQGLGKAAPAAAALAAAVQSASGADWLPDAQVQLAWLNVEMKRPAQAEKAARAALTLSSNPGYSPGLEQQARLALVQADLDQQKWDDALAGCQMLLAANPTPEVMGTILFTQAWVNEKQGKPDAAQPLWQRLASEFPQSTYAPDALLHLGDAGFKAAKYDEARAEYSSLLTKYPSSTDAPQARLGLGNALYSLGQYEAAAATFDALAAQKAANDLRPEALYWAGASLEKAGKKAAAIQRLTRLVSEYPSSTRVANAKVRLAYLKAGT